jgi:hypothetical protein
MSDTTQTVKLMGFCEVLSIIFVIAKLTGYIDWSWWWVFAPIIAHGIIGLIVLFVLLVIFLIKKE